MKGRKSLSVVDLDFLQGELDFIYLALVGLASVHGAFFCEFLRHVHGREVRRLTGVGPGGGNHSSLGRLNG